jgi:hypothetical protein
MPTRMNHCYKCGYSWTTRGGAPKKCPKCGDRQYWTHDPLDKRRIKIPPD